MKRSILSILWLMFFYSVTLAAYEAATDRLQAQVLMN